MSGRRVRRLAWLLCLAVPLLTAAVTGAFMLTAPRLVPARDSAYVILAVGGVLNAALAFAGPASGGALFAGPLRDRIGSGIACGVIGLSAHVTLVAGVWCAMYLGYASRIMTGH